MLTLSSECQEVVDRVKDMSHHGVPSMFLILVQSRTGMDTHYMRQRLLDWSNRVEVAPWRRGNLEKILLAALDVQSEQIHGIDWQNLCGVDYKIRVKMLMGEL